TLPATSRHVLERRGGPCGASRRAATAISGMAAGASVHQGADEARGEFAAEDGAARRGVAVFGHLAELDKDDLVLALVEDLEQAALEDRAIAVGELAGEHAELDPVAEVAHRVVDAAEA